MKQLDRYSRQKRDLGTKFESDKCELVKKCRANECRAKKTYEKTTFGKKTWTIRHFPDRPSKG